ncbi:protein-L-isoaspartate O-methyltransferase [Patescibacteria group bacterium]
MQELVGDLLKKGVLKKSVIEEAFLSIDRKDFVLDEFKDLAYKDHPLNIGNGQTISQPYTVAFMFDLLDPQKKDIIMDIGYGSGWTTAMLAYIVGDEGKVIAVELVPELCRLGEENVLKYPDITKRVEFYCEDATSIVLKRKFNCIIAGAAAQEKNGIEAVPDIWKKQLKIGGKIVMPIHNSIWLFIKQNEDKFEEYEYPGFVFVPLISKR